jgi:hypothetical protein
MLKKKRKHGYLNMYQVVKAYEESVIMVCAEIRILEDINS